MDSSDLSQRLSRIQTQWSVVFSAHREQAGAARSELSTLLARYSGATYRYLLAAVRDPDVADELAQEFALRFVRGDFHRASPERGRFRDYLKTALINLVNDYHRQQQVRPCAMGVEPAAAPPSEADTDADFLASWRTELLDSTWKALAANNKAYHAALRYRIENPEALSPEIAEHLTSLLDKSVNSAAARKILERAHAKFADLLLDEVACSIGAGSVLDLEQELVELDLLRYCRSALQRRNR